MERVTIYRGAERCSQGLGPAAGLHQGQYQLHLPGLFGFWWSIQLTQIRASLRQLTARSFNFLRLRSTWTTSSWKHLPSSWRCSRAKSKEQLLSTLLVKHSMTGRLASGSRIFSTAVTLLHVSVLLSAMWLCVRVGTCSSLVFISASFTFGCACVARNFGSPEAGGIGGHIQSQPRQDQASLEDENAVVQGILDPENT